jgi:hypothetical protein
LVAVASAVSVTLTTGVNVPDTVGVPEITPVDELIVTPAGNVPAVTDHVYGVVPPVAATVVEVYATLICPSGRAAGPVMLGAALITIAA